MTSLEQWCELKDRTSSWMNHVYSAVLAPRTVCVHQGKRGQLPNNDNNLNLSPKEQIYVTFSNLFLCSVPPPTWNHLSFIIVPVTLTILIIYHFKETWEEKEIAFRQCLIQANGNGFWTTENKVASTWTFTSVCLLSGTKRCAFKITVQCVPGASEGLWGYLNSRRRGYWLCLGPLRLDELPNVGCETSC